MNVPHDPTTTKTESTPPPLPIDPLSIRTDLIGMALNFLQDPQVQSAPLSRRISFLEGKGLTKQEIDLVLLRLPDQNKDSLSLSKTHNSPDTSTSWRGVLITSSLLICSASLIISNYDLLTSFFWSLWKSIKTKMNDDSAESSHEDRLSKIEAEQEEIRKLLQEIKDGLDQ